MRTIIDTGFFYALSDIKDQHHQKALNFIKSPDFSVDRSFFTTSLVINETYTLKMYRSKGNIAQLKLLDELFWGKGKFARIIFPSFEEFKKIAEVMQTYSSPSKMLSFVDASLIFFGKQLEIDEILSFDHHFDGIFRRIQ